MLELLVAIGLLSLLLALMLPAIQQARSAARRTQCLSNVRQLGIATHAYHDAHMMFPAGLMNSYSVFTRLLPHLEQQELYSRIPFGSYRGPGDGAHDSTNPLIKVRLPFLMCPDDSGNDVSSMSTGPTNYVGNGGSGLLNNGLYLGFFRLLIDNSTMGGGPLSAKDFTDGLSNTAAFSEVLVGNGTSAPFRITWEVRPRFVERGRWAEQLEICEHAHQAGSHGNRWDKGANWMDGNPASTVYNHAQTPNRNSCTNGGLLNTGIYTAVSGHSGGVICGFGDGAARFVSERVDHHVWHSVGTRAGHESATEL